MTTKHKWIRTGQNSMDLVLQDATDFDSNEYRRILSRFLSVARVGNRLSRNLSDLGQDPERTVFTFRGDRLGYDGLNRWCNTDGKQFSGDDVFAARKLWKFLFGQDNPPILAKPLGKSGLDLNEGAWNRWYPVVSGADASEIA